MDAMLTAAEDSVSSEFDKSLKSSDSDMVKWIHIWPHYCALFELEERRFKYHTWGWYEEEKQTIREMKEKKAALMKIARQIGKTNMFLTQVEDLLKVFSLKETSDDEIAARCIEMVRNPLAIEAAPFWEKPLGPCR